MTFQNTHFWKVHSIVHVKKCTKIFFIFTPSLLKKFWWHQTFHHPPIMKHVSKCFCHKRDITCHACTPNNLLSDENASKRKEIIKINPRKIMVGVCNVERILVGVFAMWYFRDLMLVCACLADQASKNDIWNFQSFWNSDFVLSIFKVWGCNFAKTHFACVGRDFSILLCAMGCGDNLSVNAHIYTQKDCVTHVLINDVTHYYKHSHPQFWNFMLFFNIWSTNRIFSFEISQNTYFRKYVELFLFSKNASLYAQCLFWSYKLGVNNIDEISLFRDEKSSFEKKFFPHIFILNLSSCRVTFVCKRQKTSFYTICRKSRF